MAPWGIGSCCFGFISLRLAMMILSVSILVLSFTSVDSVHAVLGDVAFAILVFNIGISSLGFAVARGAGGVKLLQAFVFVLIFVLIVEASLAFIGFQIRHHEIVSAIRVACQDQDTAAERQACEQEVHMFADWVNLVSFLIACLGHASLSLQYLFVSYSLWQVRLLGGTGEEFKAPQDFEGSPVGPPYGVPVGAGEAEPLRRIEEDGEARRRIA
eukprot:gnl/TRDRNA2_/TRDRNA2_41498_c0_seq1.p1 gnl/TRDRNA2_/TRDRNA2_41498_c0~~gnl/TRDRNA2_/TRDRNA2_41498_c0_seq1.p1  ORF type:complete len:214 (-),score=37.04 gnl/TRDRNA2_/TRDRNA2_41498_c0_seq1:112-753(-)